MHTGKKKKLNPNFEKVSSKESKEKNVQNPDQETILHRHVTFLCECNSYILGLFGLCI